MDYADRVDEELATRGLAALRATHYEVEGFRFERWVLHSQRHHFQPWNRRKVFHVERYNVESQMQRRGSDD